MKSITVHTTIARDTETVWQFFTLPEHIVKWNQASTDWHCPKATNDLRVGGSFAYTMASKDGTNSFDFTGTYTIVDLYKRVEYTIIDGRKVSVVFDKIDESTTKLTETFDMESTNSEELQRKGWQVILENFRKYCETLNT